MKTILIMLIPCWMLVLEGSKKTEYKNLKNNSVKSELLSHLSPTSIDDLKEGNYNIRAANTEDKYLDVDNGSRGETVRLNRIGKEKKDNIWEVRKVFGLLGGYTIASQKYQGKFLDANFLNTNENGCKVQLWNRTGLNGNVNPLDHGNPISLNQEWHINLVSGNKYRICNVQSQDMYLDARNNGVADSRVKLWKKDRGDQSQMWIFERVD